MFLSIKKLVLKITAVVTTILLIPVTIFGIKKCFDKKHKTENINFRISVTDTIGNINKEQEPKRSNSMERFESTLNSDILNNGSLPHFEISQLCFARNNILKSEGRTEKVKKIENLISEKVTKLSIDELNQLKSLEASEDIIQAIVDMKLDSKSTALKNFVSQNTD